MLDEQLDCRCRSFGSTRAYIVTQHGCRISRPGEPDRGPIGHLPPRFRRVWSYQMDQPHPSPLGALPCRPGYIQPPYHTDYTSHDSSLRNRPRIWLELSWRQGVVTKAASVASIFY